MDLAAVIPLFLEGQVYNVYVKLGPDVHNNVDSLEDMLRVVFGLSPFMTFTKFKARSLWEGKTLDAFLAKLCRLAWVICHEGATGVDKFVVCQFIDSLSELAQSQLKALKSGDREMVSILQCTKVLLAECDKGGAKEFAGRSESPFVKAMETACTRSIDCDKPVVLAHCDGCR